MLRGGIESVGVLARGLRPELCRMTAAARFRASPGRRLACGGGRQQKGKQDHRGAHSISVQSMQEGILMQGPLASLEQWDDFVKERYDPGKKQEDFRQYGDQAPDGVREFYRLNHTHQSRAFVQQKKREYLALEKRRMGIWEAMEYLNTLVDDSDPDTDLSQIEHLLQTAESIRRDGHPR